MTDFKLHSILYMSENYLEGIIPEYLHLIPVGIPHRHHFHHPQEHSCNLLHPPV